MPHLITRALQDAFWIRQIGTAPEAEVDGVLESFDVGKGAIALINGLRPLNRFLRLRSCRPDERGDLGDDLSLPWFQTADISCYCFFSYEYLLIDTNNVKFRVIVPF